MSWPDWFGFLIFNSVDWEMRERETQRNGGSAKKKKRERRNRMNGTKTTEDIGYMWVTDRKKEKRNIVFSRNKTEHLVSSKLLQTDNKAFSQFPQ